LCVKLVIYKNYGRLRLRWEGDVGEVLGRIKIQIWSDMAMDREAWKRVAEEAETYEELYCQENKKAQISI